ncbi:unnamed protein product [Rotaria sp. Silwood2]|nr:unnamed protein product [Rotaria sp. Silwood2]CAF4212060.1 unnamed protein product [Rotaria sp. Silwood2]CAF4345921.1 unnamed protein product [Rotaria sp. Silwood2]
MKLFCDLLTRHRSNKKKEIIKSTSSSINILSNNAKQSINRSISPRCDQSLSLFDKQTKCTCHYFNVNGNCLTKNVHTKLIPIYPTFCSSLSSQPSINMISSLDCPSHAKYILTVADFCFWYDVRSTLLDIIDRVVVMNEVHHFVTEKNCSTIVKFCLPQINPNHRKMRRPKTSIAIQTSFDNKQRRNAKVQTTTVTLFPIQKQNLSSSRLFLN